MDRRNNDLEDVSSDKLKNHDHSITSLLLVSAGHKPLCDCEAQFEIK